LKAKITNTEQNYLKAIYHLEQQHGQVTNNYLATALAIKPATATDMLKKLQLRKWLAYKPYKGFSLTATGTEEALKIIRRHRLWEFFLVEKLQINWDLVHDIAEDLEHVSNPLLIEKLDAYLGNPHYDPHGDPIPNAKGKLPKNNRIVLSQAKIMQWYRIDGVTSDSKDFLQLFKSLSLAMGLHIMVQEKHSFDNSLLLQIDKNNLQISALVAQHILVTAI
jgi:DtxR family transcriptional regulator, Mn-dependent transcriptional regulator